MFVNVLLAQNTNQSAGGFDITSLLLPVALGLFIFMMFRKQKKVQNQLQDQRSQMLPGTHVMTQFGLYGTIVSIDQENNKAVLELSPGNTATVHTQALTKVITESEPVVAESSQVPDDASSLTHPQAGPEAPAGETPEETIERLNREQKKNDN